jgi:hypothetical protein
MLHIQTRSLKYKHTDSKRKENYFAHPLHVRPIYVYLTQGELAARDLQIL